MGKGIDMARAAGAGIHADVLDDLKDQLLIVLIRRLGGDVQIPVSEIDDTGGCVLSFSITDRKFNFKLGSKQ